MLLKEIMRKRQSKVPIISGSFYQTSTLISHSWTQVAMTILLSGSPVLKWMKNGAMRQEAGGQKSTKVTWDSDSRQRPSSRWFNTWCGASLDDYGTHPKGVWSSSTAIMPGSSLRDGLAVARQKTPERKMRLSEMVAFWVTFRLKMTFIFAFFFLRFVILSHCISRRHWRLWKICLFVGFGKQQAKKRKQW